MVVFIRQAARPNRQKEILKKCLIYWQKFSTLYIKQCQKSVPLYLNGIRRQFLRKFLLNCGQKISMNKNFNTIFIYKMKKLLIINFNFSVIQLLILKKYTLSDSAIYFNLLVGNFWFQEIFQVLLSKKRRASNRIIIVKCLQSLFILRAKS